MAIGDVEERARGVARAALAHPLVVAWEATEHGDPLSEEEEQAAEAVHQVLRDGLEQIVRLEEV